MWKRQSEAETVVGPRVSEDWLVSVPRAPAGGAGADPDVVDFHRWAAGEPERIRWRRWGRSRG